MTTIQQVNSAIMFGDFTNTELDSIINAIKFRRSCMAQQAKRSFTVGSRVQFHNTRTGRDMSGIVEKMARKFATVRVAGTLWRVPANMLSAGAEA
jgi:hypothetical protein